MLDDPRVNFAISNARARAPGVDHIGIQVDSRAELDELASRLKAAGEHTFDEEASPAATPRATRPGSTIRSGVRWETFYTFGDATTYGEDPKIEAAARVAPPARLLRRSREVGHRLRLREEQAASGCLRLTLIRPPISSRKAAARLSNVQPITGLAAWKGGEIVDDPGWIHRFTAAEIAELDRAIKIRKGHRQTARRTDARRLRPAPV